MDMSYMYKEHEKVGPVPQIDFGISMANRQLIWRIPVDWDEVKSYLKRLLMHTAYRSAITDLLIENAIPF